jgi:hypothetical protein
MDGDETLKFLSMDEDAESRRLRRLAEDSEFTTVLGDEEAEKEDALRSEGWRENFFLNVMAAEEAEKENALRSSEWRTDTGFSSLDPIVLVLAAEEKEKEHALRYGLWKPKYVDYHSEIFAEMLMREEAEKEEALISGEWNQAEAEPLSLKNGRHVLPNVDASRWMRQMEQRIHIEGLVRAKESSCVARAHHKKKRRNRRLELQQNSQSLYNEKLTGQLSEREEVSPYIRQLEQDLSHDEFKMEAAVDAETLEDEICWEERRELYVQLLTECIVSKQSTYISLEGYAMLVSAHEEQEVWREAHERAAERVVKGSTAVKELVRSMWDILRQVEWCKYHKQDALSPCGSGCSSRAENKVFHAECITESTFREFLCIVSTGPQKINLDEEYMEHHTNDDDSMTTDYVDFFERVYELCAESIGAYENWLGQNQFHFGYCEVEKKEYREVLRKMKQSLQNSHSMNTKRVTKQHYEQTEDALILARGDAAMRLAECIIAM